MPNVLIIKVADGHFMSSYKVSQDYSGAQAKCDDLMARHNGGNPCVGMALCDAALMSAAQESGKHFDAGPASGSDFDLIQKSAITTETAILPEGMTLDDIDDADYVVVYS